MPKSDRALPLWIILLYAALAFWCAGVIVFGAMNSQSTLGMALLATGLLGALVVGASFPVALLLHRISREGGGGERRNQPAASTDRLLTQIYENSMLSDNAKRVLFRDRELELLRAALNEDISRGDYHAGLTLCDEMANLFGQREEAEAFRTRILQAGHASFESKVQQELTEFDRILQRRDWAGAHREAARIKRLYPNHHSVQSIEQHIMLAREDHKKELEAQFIEAANRDDVGAAMSLLKELDRYLTRDEAGRLANIAQNVVVKHRENLSMQFKMAVNEHRWAEAAHVGDAIIAEYPNTKMADEVRTMIDVLRVRATQAAVMAEG